MPPRKGEEEGEEETHQHHSKTVVVAVTAAAAAAEEGGGEKRSNVYLSRTLGEGKMVFTPVSSTCPVFPEISLLLFQKRKRRVKGPSSPWVSVRLADAMSPQHKKRKKGGSCHHALPHITKKVVTKMGF